MSEHETKEQYVIGTITREPGSVTIATDRGEHVARMLGPNGFQDHAAMLERATSIVRAVNAHDDLLNALEALLEADVYADGEGLAYIAASDTVDGEKAVALARAAIGKAKAEATP
jgi:hypothetical protein